MSTTYRVIARDVDAIQFDGQELPGVELNYLGTDEVGLPLYQGILRFHGGEATLYRGDWLVEGKVYTAAEFFKAFEPATKPPPTVEPPASTVVADAVVQAEIDGLQARINALRAGTA